MILNLKQMYWDSVDNKTKMLFLFALAIAAFFLFVPVEVLAEQKANNINGNTLVLTRKQIEEAGGGVDTIASNTVGTLGTTGIRIAYGLAYVVGVLSVFFGIIGLRKQFQQDETQRKFIWPGAQIVFGVLLTGFLTIFLLLADNTGLGSSVGAGADKEKIGNVGMGIGRDGNSDGTVGDKKRW